MHRHPYKDLTVEVFNDPTFTLGSADNNNIYSKTYSTDLGQFQPTSKHGVRIFKDDEEINNCIVIALGGGTGIHPTSSIVDNDQLLICCCDTIFCLTLPDLQLKWKTRADSATCFQIFKLQADYIVHGEMEITRIDSDGRIKWQYGGADIFVELDGDAFALHPDHIEVTDFYKTKYKVDFNGQTISTSRQTPPIDQPTKGFIGIPKQNLVWVIIILALNFLAIQTLLQIIRLDHSDKAPLLFWFYYPLIILGDIVLWSILKKRNKSLSRQVRNIIIILLILFLPLLFYAFGVFDTE